jgi:hypothetical protein
MPFANLLQRVTLATILLFGFCTIVFFALTLFLISAFAPGFGIRAGADALSCGDSSAYLGCLLRSFYFSVTTFTSIGYADLTPGDFAKVIVTLEVILGNSTMGVAVAKLVSLGSDDLRKAHTKCVEGYWINRVTREQCITYGLVRFDTDHIYGLNYYGENYSSDGHFSGGFYCHLASITWPKAVFRWQDKDNNLFREGEVRLRFHDKKSSNMSGTAYRYEGIIVQHGTRDTQVVEGWRILDSAINKMLETPSERSAAIVKLISLHFGQGHEEITTTSNSQPSCFQAARRRVASIFSKRLLRSTE